MQLTDNNFLKFYASDEGEHLLPKSWAPRYLGCCSDPPPRFFSIAKQTALKIIQNGMTKPVVYLSGGMDSEIVARSFLAAEVPFRAATLRFKYGLNDHDFYYAERFCRDHQIDHEIVTLDVVKFFNGPDALRLAQMTESVSPQFLTTMWLMEQIDGNPILGSGECYLVKRNSSDYIPRWDDYTISDNLRPTPGISYWDLWEKEKVSCLYRFLERTSRPGVAGFFQYSAEIVYSYLNLPLIRQLINNKIPATISTAKLKNPIWENLYPGIIKRKPQTGFEGLQTADQDLRGYLQTKYKYRNRLFRTEYNELLRQLRGEQST